MAAMNLTQPLFILWSTEWGITLGLAWCLYNIINLTSLLLHLMIQLTGKYESEFRLHTYVHVDDIGITLIWSWRNFHMKPNTEPFFLSALRTTSHSFHLSLLCLNKSAGKLWGPEAIVFIFFSSVSFRERKETMGVGKEEEIGRWIWNNIIETKPVWYIFFQKPQNWRFFI